MNDDQIMAKLSQIIRVGVVNARQPEKMRVKVTIPDTVGKPLITDFLPVLTPRACEDMQYDLPDIGDQVLCLFLAYGLEQGFVIGAMYGGNNPPVQSGDKWHRTFKDGTTLEYDREEHKLVANVQGDVEITASGNIRAELEGELSASAQGPASIKSASQISMDSPSMNIGGSGGTNAKMQGNFNLTKGDVTAESVSLVNHVHTCPACGAQTSPPIGGGGGGSGGSGESGGSGSGDGDESGNENGGDDGTESGNGETGGSESGDGGKLPTAIVPGIINEYAAHIPNAIAVGPDFKPDEEMEKALRELQGNLETDVDKLIFCLPDIVQYIAENEVTGLDSEFWLYLRDFLLIWLAGKANKEALTNDSPVFISWDRIMKYDRARKAYKALIDPEYLFSKNAKKLLFERLEADNLIDTKEHNFNYIIPINGDYRSWLNKYFQSISVDRQTFAIKIPDGLTAAMASFMLYALAKGTVKPHQDGGHEIIVEEVAIIVRDAFNFTDTPEDIAQGKSETYRFWKCEPPDFSLLKGLAQIGSKELHNTDFNELRRLGHGNDFMVLAGPHVVENLGVTPYVYP